MKKRTLALFLAMAMACMMIAGCSSQQDTSQEGGTQEPTANSGWPEKTIEMICPYSAGGGSDTMARQVAEALNRTGMLGDGNVIGHGLCGKQA